MEAINTIFTTEEQKELKDSLKEVIISQFRNQLEETYNDLFDTNEIENFITESFEEVIDDIKIEFKEKLREQMLKLLENNDMEKLISLKKKVK